ncbi:sigma-70 family RNA polymerase sigma factor [Marmoricola sp. Leaf446]|uniref:sigma-70 family RNA polymerase sigma factor n=1 Tax=Marmoricola sp. Leaf446 TaxID=1736379 RepID=UPI0009EC3C81|nr:sigma-70 family RNA polymerase sigma factor [Marmoricola sp. Leaf446]
MDVTTQFEGERPRLVALATRVLGDRDEAEDVVQQAWLRLDRTDRAGTGIDNLAAWLTTVTTRLCLDRLRARVPVPEEELEPGETAPDPAEEVALAETVGVALQVVLDRLSPRERVAFVLHDSFGFEFGVVASVLATSETAARKLASRARAKVAQPAAEDPLADWEVVDAFMAAARGGDLARLLTLLAPGAGVTADDAAVLAGTPSRIDGREAVAAFFDGSAHAALAVHVDGRPGYAWFHRGEARVVFDFDVADGRVRGIVFRAEPGLLGRVARRTTVTPAASHASEEQEPGPTGPGRDGEDPR